MTFLNAPSVTLDEIEAGMLVAGGVTSEFTGVTPGTSMAPAAIRRASQHIHRRRAQSPEFYVESFLDCRKVRLRDDPPLADAGDVPNLFPQVERMTDAIASFAEAIASRDALPIVFGGDHYVTYPLTRGWANGRRALGDRRFGYIQFDMHLDLCDVHPVHGTHWHGSNGRRTSELEGFSPSRMVWVGFNDVAHADEWEFVEQGATVMSVDAVRAEGIEAATCRALEIACESADAVYLSLDMDVVDVATARGVGACNIGGMSGADLLRAMYLLGSSELIRGFDVVEVSPLMDTPSQPTAFLAARAAFAFLGERLVEFL